MTLFDQIEEGLDGDVNTETIGDHREAHAILVQVGDIIDRLSVRLDEIQSGG